MKRMRMWSTAAVLPFLVPLGAGAVADTKRDLPETSTAVGAGLRGPELAIQVAPGLALGLRGKPGETVSPTPGSGSEHRARGGDGGGGAAAPIPEPSSLPLFAASLLWARGAARRTRRRERR